MSSFVEEFKRLQDFWRSQEENNLAPRAPCDFFRRRTLINDQIPQSIIESSSSTQLDINAINTNSLNTSVEEQNSDLAVSNDDLFEHESLRCYENTISSLTTEFSLEKQDENPDILITDISLLSLPSYRASLTINLNDRSHFLHPIAEQIEQNELSDDVGIQDNLCEIPRNNQLLAPANINNDSDSVLSFVSSNDEDDTECSSIRDEPVISREKIRSSIIINQEDNFFDDDWLFQTDHIFVLSFAGKPIFSLQRHGFEDKMSSLFGLIHCFISVFESRRDRIQTIEADGIKFVFLIRNSVYLVAASRENNKSEHHLKLQLREVYNRIGFLLTFAQMNRIFEDTPSYDLRKQLCGNYNLISNQLTSDIRVSNNIFTLFTNTIRVLPLHPTARFTIQSIIQKKCCKIKNLAFAIVIVDDQLVALVRLTNQTLHSSDIRLILNLMECSEDLFNNFNLWMLPICLPNFNKDCYLHAYISSISVECDAFLILLSYDRNNAEELSQIHREITASLHEHNWFKTISRQINNASQIRNGFNIEVINIPELWHFMYMPKSSNHQLLCSKIIPPYTCVSEFKRLEAIYRDLHYRIHNRTQPLKFIFEAKEKEVAIALETETAEIYAVFDPLVDKISVANRYMDELIRWINYEKEAYFIRRYPKF